MQRPNTAIPYVYAATLDRARDPQSHIVSSQFPASSIVVEKKKKIGSYDVTMLWNVKSCFLFPRVQLVIKIGKRRMSMQNGRSTQRNPISLVICVKAGFLTNLRATRLTRVHHI